MGQTVIPPIGMELADLAYQARGAAAADEAFGAYTRRRVKTNWELARPDSMFSLNGVGFGFVLRRKVARPRARARSCPAPEHAVVIRGTQTLGDVLTDIDARPASGPAGTLVHKGFKDGWDGLKDEVTGFLQDAHGPIHIAGHSLGGALATLCALDLRQSDRSVRLYTYASPRVVLGMSSGSATRTLRAAEVYRVFDWADPVPMLPPWPYRHVPTGFRDYRLGQGGRISWMRHLSESYHRGLEGKTWRNLSAASEQVPDTYLLRSADRFLRLAEQSSSFSAIGYYAIGRALSLLLGAIDVSFAVTALAGATALDLLRYLAQQLKRGLIAVHGAVRGVVERAVSAALRWAGKAISRVDIVHSFLSYVAETVRSVIVQAARVATLDRG